MGAGSEGGSEGGDMCACHMLGSGFLIAQRQRWREGDRRGIASK